METAGQLRGSGVGGLLHRINCRSLRSLLLRDAGLQRFYSLLRVDFCLPKGGFRRVALLGQTALQLVDTLTRALHLFVRIDAHPFDDTVHVGGELGHVRLGVGPDALQLDELKNARRT